MSDPTDKPPEGLAHRPAGEPDPELIRQFLHLQAQEINLRFEQINLQKQSITNSHEYAQKSLEADLVDFDRERKHTRTIGRDRMVFAGFVVLVFAAFITIALYLNKDQVAMEVIKTLGTLLIGGLGGYSIARLKPKKEEEKDEEDEE